MNNIIYLKLIFFCELIFGLNMFLVPQVLVKFRISPSSKLYINLVFHI